MTELKPCPFCDITFSVLGWYPLKPDCTDEEFEELLRWLGFEIEEDNDGNKRLELVEVV